MQDLFLAVLFRVSLVASVTCGIHPPSGAPAYDVPNVKTPAKTGLKKWTEHKWQKNATGHNTITSGFRALNPSSRTVTLTSC
jgi:hypothetical protein